MEITIDPDAGFCIGVTRAIRMAEEAAKKGPVATLGDIVHNPAEDAPANHSFFSSSACETK